MAGGLGACCTPFLPEVGCFNLSTKQACDDMNGLWQGHGTSCATTDCSAVLCSCCDNNVDPHVCIPGLTVAECMSVPGRSARGPVGCPPDVCPQGQIVPCCDPLTGQCMNMTEEECFERGGCNVGPFQDCTTVDCFTDVPVGCCIPDAGGGEPECLGAEFQLTSDTCQQFGGTPFCPGICTEDSCGTIPGLGACCRQNGTCFLGSAEDCENAFGEFQGEGTTCEYGACNDEQTVKECRTKLAPYYRDGDKQYSTDICAPAFIGFAVDPDHNEGSIVGLFRPTTLHETRSTDVQGLETDPCRYHRAYLMLKPSGKPVLALCSKHDGEDVVNLGGFAIHPNAEDINGLLEPGQAVGICATENPRHGEVQFNAAINYCDIAN